MKESVHQPTGASYFYPASSADLKAEVSNLLSLARKEIALKKPSKIYGLVAPHSRYSYSGKTAAFAYSLLDKKDFNRVIIVSPSHYQTFEGFGVFSGKSYKTPLGEVRIDRELRDLFLEIGGSGAPITYSDHKDEHAIEVQLPFLQVCLEDFKLLPILMGNESPEHAKQLGRILSEVLSEDENVLLVAGSDLSHCYDSKKAARLDKACSEDIAHLDPDALIKDLDSDKYGACGEGPIVAALLAAKRLGAHHAAVLHHCNSGEITQDKTSVADYLSAVIYN